MLPLNTIGKAKDIAYFYKNHTFDGEYIVNMNEDLQQKAWELLVQPQEKKPTYNDDIGEGLVLKNTNGDFMRRQDKRN